MKRVFALVLTLAMILMASAALTGCGGTKGDTGDSSTSGESSQDTTGGEEKTYKVGLSMNSFDSYQVIWYEAFVEEAEALGMEVMVTNADSDADTQITDVENFIVNDCDAVVICAVDPDGSAPAFNACTEAGVPVIAAQFTTTAEYSVMAGSVATDQTLNGLIQCLAIEEWMEKNPGVEIKAGYLQGAMGVWTAEERYQGFVDNLPDGAELVVANTANWNADEAQSLVEDWLITYPELNCIAAANDDMAIAAVNVLKAQGRTDFSDFLILGLNAQEDACDYIREGSMYQSVYYGQDKEAAFAARVCYAVLQGVDFGGEWIQSEGEVTDWLLSVTKENVDTFQDDYDPQISTVEELLAWEG